MKPQVRKNIRQAFLGQDMSFGSPAWQASRSAARYIDEQPAAVDLVLAAMNLLTVAHFRKTQHDPC